MNPVIINQHSEDKDASIISHYYVALEGVVIWPVTMVGKRVEEVEAQRYIV